MSRLRRPESLGVKRGRSSAARARIAGRCPGSMCCIIKRRVEAAGLPYPRCHTFRATAITTYLQNGGTLEHAQTSPITNRPERLSDTISPARNSRSRKSRASTSKPVPNFASSSRAWFKSQRAVLRSRKYTRRPPSRTTRADVFARRGAKPCHNRIEHHIRST
jgi:hypothetical protein